MFPSPATGVGPVNWFAPESGTMVTVGGRDLVAADVALRAGETVIVGVAGINTYVVTGTELTRLGDGGNDPNRSPDSDAWTSAVTVTDVLEAGIVAETIGAEAITRF